MGIDGNVKLAQKLRTKALQVIAENEKNNSRRLIESLKSIVDLCEKEAENGKFMCKLKNRLIKEEANFLKSHYGFLVKAKCNGDEVFEDIVKW